MREESEPRPVGHKVGSVYGTVSNSAWPNLRVTNVRDEVRQAWGHMMGGRVLSVESIWQAGELQ